jgi:AbrB family looped-hinge helix DNA binding protein
LTDKVGKFTIWKVRKEGREMQIQPKTEFQSEWVKILTKGMITIPKSFREELGIKEGEVARIKKVGQRLILETREVADYETYSDQEFKKMLEEDKLPAKLASEAANLWPDLK